MQARQSSETRTLQWICKVRAEKVWTNFRSAAMIKHNIVFVVYRKNCQIVVISLRKKDLNYLFYRKGSFASLLTHYKNNEYFMYFYS